MSNHPHSLPDLPTEHCATEKEAEKRVCLPQSDGSRAQSLAHTMADRARRLDQQPQRYGQRFRNAGRQHVAVG